MAERSDVVYLEHILVCIRHVIDYTRGLSEKEFIDDHKTRDAVVRNFEIIGEATKKLSERIRNNHPQIEWKKIAGMRDKLIHDYIEVDYWAVWNVVTDILPGFEAQITNIIAEEK